MLKKYSDKVAGYFSHFGFRRYFANTSWLFIGKFFNLLVAFFATTYVVRELGPDNYGLLSYAISFSGLASIVANLGIDSIVSRELVRDPDRKDTIIGTSLAIKLAGALVSFGIMIIATMLSGNNLSTSVLILIISASYFFSSFNVVNLVFQARARALAPTILTFIVATFLSILKVIFVYYQMPLYFLAFVYFLEPLLYAIGFIYIYIVQEHTVAFLWKWSTSEALTIMRDSWPLIISGIFTAIYSRIDQVMLKTMIDTRAVGLYDPAVRLAELWYFIPALIVASLFPALINAKKVDSALYDRRIGRLYFLLTWLGAGVTVFIFVFAPLIISILFGAAYAGSVTVLRLYVLATIAVFITNALYQHLVNENRTGIIFFSSVVGAVANVILNIFLIPRYGINGAALSTFISYSFIPFSVFFFKKTRKHGWLMLRSMFIFQ